MLFFTLIKDFIMSFLGKSINLSDLQKNLLKIFAGVVLLASIFFSGFFYSKNHWQAPLKEQISEFQKSETNLTNQLIQIKDDTQKSLQIAQLKIEATQKSLDDISTKYEEEKNKAPRYVYLVKDPRNPNKQISVEFDKKGNQICSKFSDSYSNVLNKMIDEVNKK